MTIRAEDKRIINAGTDVNILVPFRHNFAWEAYLAGTERHWMPGEIDLTNDRDGVVNELAAGVVANLLGHFRSYHNLSQYSPELGIYRQTTSPECRQYLLRLMFENTVHQTAIESIVDRLGFNPNQLVATRGEIDAQNEINQQVVWFRDVRVTTEGRSGEIGFILALLSYLVRISCFRSLMAFYVAANEQVRGTPFQGTISIIERIARDRAFQRDFIINMVLAFRAENTELWEQNRTVIENHFKGILGMAQYDEVSSGRERFGINGTVAEVTALQQVTDGYGDYLTTRLGFGNAVWTPTAANADSQRRLMEWLDISSREATPAAAPAMSNGLSWE